MTSNAKKTTANKRSQKRTTPERPPKVHNVRKNERKIKVDKRKPQRQRQADHRQVAATARRTTVDALPKQLDTISEAALVKKAMTAYCIQRLCSENAANVPLLLDDNELCGKENLTPFNFKRTIIGTSNNNASATQVYNAHFMLDPYAVASDANSFLNPNGAQYLLFAGMDWPNTSSAVPTGDIVHAIDTDLPWTIAMLQAGNTGWVPRCAQISYRYAGNADTFSGVAVGTAASLTRENESSLFPLGGQNLYHCLEVGTSRSSTGKTLEICWSNDCVDTDSLDMTYTVGTAVPDRPTVILGVQRNASETFYVEFAVSGLAWGNLDNTYYAGDTKPNPIPRMPHFNDSFSRAKEVVIQPKGESALTYAYRVAKEAFKQFASIEGGAEGIVGLAATFL